MTTPVHLSDILDPEDLRAAHSRGLISIQPSTTASGGSGLHIYNYTSRATYTRGAWNNPAVRACRGLIVDDQSMIIARPWEKFFNHTQPETGDIDPNTPVEVTDKLDGSLGIVFTDMSGQPRVATRGAFESDQAIIATQMLREPRFAGLQLDPTITPMVEIIYPDNRIILDYGGLRDLVLLGAVENATGQYLGTDEAADRLNWPGVCAEVFTHRTFADALRAQPRPNSEGLCVRLLDENKIVKLKQADYVRLHAIASNLSLLSLWRHACNGGTLESLLTDLPDELHGWTREHWQQMAQQIEATVEETEELYCDLIEQLPLDVDRKAFAAAVQALPKHQQRLKPYLFLRHNGIDARPAILKAQRPHNNQPAMTPEENAE